MQTLSRPSISRVLIADDDVAHRQALARLLRREGFDVVTAGTAVEAVRMVESERVAVAVVRGGFDGLRDVELLEAMRRVDAGLQLIRHTGPVALEGRSDDSRKLVERIRLAAHARTVEALRQSEERLRSITGNAPDLILQVDRGGTIIYVNRSLPGWTAEEVLGTNLSVWTPPGYRNVIGEALERVFATLEEQQYETESEHSDGYRRWFAGRISPVVVDERATSAIIVSRNITSRKWFENLQAAQNRILEMTATGRELQEILETLTSMVEALSVRMRCSVWELDGAGPSLRAAPSLPAELTELLVRDPTPLGLGRGPAVIDSIASSDLPEALRDAMLFHGVQACWTQPIVSGGKRLLGSFALFYDTPRAPGATELELLDSVARLAAAAIERRRFERETRLLSAAVETARIGIACVDPNGRYVAVNEPYAALFGSQPQQMVGDAWNDNLHPEDHETAETAHRSMTRDGQAEFEARALPRDGSLFYQHVTLLKAGAGAGFEGHYCFLRDVTARRNAQEEHKRLELQLRQSQKMEALGQLAGGVAHDFNNLLTAILGNVEMLIGATETDPAEAPADLVAGLQQIRYAGERAASLTRQLLTFGRKQVRELEVLNLNHIALVMEDLLRRIIGENIKLETRLADRLVPIRGDGTQIEQVILNLAVNARDAMVDGGTLTIETSNVTIDEKSGADLPCGPGRHALITVRDTGLGMSAEVRSRIFEPFFTTKPVGKGTGLGLATVYGIVSQADGHVTVESEPGRGSTFHVYLPAADPDESREAADHAGAETVGAGTVLVTEDEEAVRHLTSRFLRRAGYRVFEAENGRRAMELVEHEGLALDLLVTDAVMPEMNGRELADALTRKQGNLPVLFISGYADDVIATHGVLDDAVDFLPKPFSGASLLQRVRRILGRARPDQPGSRT